MQLIQTTKSLILRMEMFSINFVTFAFCKVLFRHDSFKMSPLMLFKWIPYQLPNKEYLITLFRICRLRVTS